MREGNKRVILGVTELFLHQREDSWYHVFGEHLADNCESHAHFDQVCALKILQRRETSAPRCHNNQIIIYLFIYIPRSQSNSSAHLWGHFGF